MPKQLLELPAGKLVGLILDPSQLLLIRTRRQNGGRMAQTRYNEPAEVNEEIEWSRGVFAKLQCPVLDATEVSIEEISTRILDRMGIERRLRP